MKDKNGKELKLKDHVWFILPHCSGNGTIKKFTKTTCHVLCAGETYNGLRSRRVTFLERKPKQ